MALLVPNRPIPDGDPVIPLANFLGVPPEDVNEVEIVKRGLDARARVPAWRGNYRVVVRDEEAVLGRGLPGVRVWTERDGMRLAGDVPAVAVERWRDRPIVVGAGPAGLFAALRMAESGAAVTLIERGGPVEDRVPAVNGFWRGKPLDAENNILFGEGGAGTFSDGKIYTRRRDGELGWIFKVLVEAGADPGILQESYAHLGTDRVRAILPVLRDRLVRAGVVIRFHMAVRSFLVESGRCVGVVLNGGEELRGGPVVVAAGHSARDTLAAMVEAGAAAELRPIAIGARVEHPQALIDDARYGVGRGDLPPASYRLAHNPPGGRSAYTFCMCPGGMVVPAQHQPGQIVVNGMSFAARRAMWANAALIVQVHPEDYAATDALAGLRYQERIERAAALASGSYAAPAQRVDDFLAGRESTDLPRTSYPMGVVSADLRALFPTIVVEGMRAALRAFEREIPGYAGAQGVLIAPETRTTAPLRFARGADMHSASLPGLCPVGEGAGYAGGIISAALDGFRAAEAIIRAQ